MFYNDSIEISSETWYKLLDDKDVTREKDFNLLKLIYDSDNHEATASSLAIKLSMIHYAPLNAQIARFSKRVIEKTKINPPLRRDGRVRWWHVPFLGYEKGGKFPWILRPELTMAFDKILGKQDSLIVYPDEISPDDRSQGITEGKLKQIYINIYERNRTAREKCIEHYGAKCIICGFDFEKFYGPIGKNKIHVHHIVPLSQLKMEYKVNPIKDLRPICPNCHLIIHSKNEPFTIEEMKEIIKNAQDDRYY